MAAAQRPSVLGSLALIAVVIGLSAALFAYTAGWFSPRRLTPDKVVAAFSPPNDTGAWPPPQPCEGDLLYRRL